jgi:L-lactate dehydrogenase complex protein LldG
VSDAKAEILARVRSALADVPAGEAAEIPRAYDRSRDGMGADLFTERVEDYRATVTRVHGGSLVAAIAERCRERGVRRLGIPADLEWRPEGVELVVDDGLAPERLDELDGALTAAALGIAETGTIVLDGGVGQGRRALSLVPDYHLCVVREDQIVGTVPEAIARLEGTLRPITFISGPSATSDIELSRVEGVHGPRTLDVLLA